MRTRLRQIRTEAGQAAPLILYLIGAGAMILVAIGAAVGHTRSTTRANQGLTVEEIFATPTPAPTRSPTPEAEPADDPPVEHRTQVVYETEPPAPAPPAVVVVQSTPYPEVTHDSGIDEWDEHSSGDSGDTGHEDEELYDPHDE